MTTWDEVAETTAVTSNPAAGTISVDVKTFTGRGRVTAIDCSAVADATVANRYLQMSKVSGANVIIIARSATITASGTGYMRAARGWQAAYNAEGAGMADTDFAPGDILRVILNNGQAGDDLSAITYSYKEML